ncbi:MAG TPA: hypothetical protein V6D46_00605, partial [Coleofasciculaceae cyanobacterium]
LLLLPVEQQPVVVVLVSAIALVALVWLAVRTIWPAWLAGLRRLDSGWVPWWVLTVGAIGPLLLMVGLIYSGEGDLSVAPRYQFVHFPLVAIGMGLALGQVAAGRWPVTIGRWRWPGRSVVAILLVASLGGGLLVAENWGFQKSRQADRLWDWINDRSPGPTLLVTEIETAAEVRSTVAIAYEWQRRRDRQASENADENASTPPQFLMLRHESDRADARSPLAVALAQASRPLDLWLIDNSPELDLALVGCPRIPEPRSNTGYRLRHHRCTGPNR